MARRALVLVAAARVAPSGAVQPGDGLAVQANQFHMWVQLDVERGFDAVDQIARHASRQRRPTHQHVELGSVLRQKHRSPAVRVAAAFELFQPRHVGQAVACAAGDNHDACIQQASVVDLDGELALRP